MRAPRTLRRYIARRFMTTILAAFGLCLVLIFMIDIVELLRQSGKFGSVSAWRIAAMAFLRLPAYTEATLSFAVLVGSIGALLLLSRKSELTVMRAAGMSVWQFLRPGLIVAFALGVFAVMVYNPLAAAARAESEQLFAESFGRESTILKTEGAGLWLRQDGSDGPSVINAAASAERGLKLIGVTIIQYDHAFHFVERIDAARAELQDGYWSLEKAWVSRFGAPAEQYEHYVVSSYLTPERVQDALGSVASISIYQLPGLIEVVEKAGLSATRYRIQYELLRSRPLLLVVMVLLGATVSLRSFRFGKIQTMVIIGMIGGLGFFLLYEISRQIGIAGLTSPQIAAWVPVVVACLVSLTVLLHQEDG